MEYEKLKIKENIPSNSQSPLLELLSTMKHACDLQILVDIECQEWRVCP